MSLALSLIFEVTFVISDSDAVFLPSHFSDILNASKQMQIKSLAKVDSDSFSIGKNGPALTSTVCDP